VAEELNFSRAAERLHMAQSPLSVAIRQLEQELSTDLFVRTSREVRLTEAGIALLDGARRTPSEADAAVVAAQRAASGAVGSLRIGYSWSARFETLPALGQAFKDRHPEVELLAEETWNDRMPMALRAHDRRRARPLPGRHRRPDLCDRPQRARGRAAVVEPSPRLRGGGRARCVRRRRAPPLPSRSRPAPARRLGRALPCGRLRTRPAQRVIPHPLDDRILGATRRRARAAVGIARSAARRGRARDHPPALLETQVVWRNGDDTAIVAAFGEVATAVFSSGVGHAAA
jgi:DNA-binding transcriptional LysR family regulator